MSSSIILTIVVILGIIVAGGFLLYFFGDLLMSLSNKNKDFEAIKNKQKEEQKALEARISALENSEEARKDPQIATILYNGAVVENYNPNEGEKVEEAPAEEPAPQVEEVKEEAPAAEEPVAQQTREDEVSEYIRKRRLELMERLSKLQQDEKTEEAVVAEEKPAAEETPAEEPVAEETPAEETAEETTEEATEETPVEDAVEETPVVEEEPVVEETPVEEPAIEEPVEEETEEVDEDLPQPKAEVAPAVNVVNTLTATNTLEELEAKLADAQEKLKVNEKELRQCKKEYLPLRKVKKTLENDEKKLRRKEALVAKQKVVLYGVNNYADIDEEKAKRLAEDLDLLDGLKLSVQHCEEVISKNKERYPLLEKIYNLLVVQNDEIKADISDLKEAIDTLKGQNPADDTTDAE